MKKYTVRVACEVAGQWRTPDVPFPLTDAQARELAPPFGDVVMLYEESTNAKLPRDKR